MIAIVSLWFLFGVTHSVLASETVKKHVRDLFGETAQRFYRLSFTCSSLLFFTPIAWMHVTEAPNTPFLWSFSGNVGALAKAIAVSCFVMFIISLRLYNMSDFLGLGALRGSKKKLKDSSAALAGDDVFSITVFHRYVRHPWYCFMLGMAWSQPMTPLRLASALCGTAYLVLGARLEEAKLRAHPGWGRQYAEYAEAVGGFVPLPWKILSHADAERLVREAAGHSRYSCSRRPLHSPRRCDSDSD